MNTIKLPPYENYPCIINNEVSLRQVKLSEIKAIVEISYYNSVQAKTLQQAIEMQAKINADYVSGTSIHWGIAENVSNNIVGTCGYYRGFSNEAGELGCVLLPQFRGQGYMSSAMQLAIEFGKATIGLKRIWAVTTRHNEKAIKLIEKLNFYKVTDLNDDEVEYELK